MKRPEVKITEMAVSAYRIPTDYPESDGTLEWTSTTLVVVEAHAGGKTGIGYTYADRATACLITDLLAAVVEGRDALDVNASWSAMLAAIRNLGRAGIASMAIAAVDVALWDLKARLLDLSLVDLLGSEHNAIPIYGSGGFTSYDDSRLCAQLSGWAERGIGRVKMKVGREPARDSERVAVARDAIGPGIEMFVDANGAYSRKQALLLADSFARLGVVWFEEPVSSDDSTGCGSYVIARPPGSRLRQESMATMHSTFAACSMPARSISSKPTPRDVRVLPASCASLRSAKRTRCRFLRIVVPRFTCIPVVQSVPSFTSNISTITSVSSKFSSTVRPVPSTGKSRRTVRAPASVSN
jgi:hypothetical protein